MKKRIIIATIVFVSFIVTSYCGIPDWWRIQYFGHADGQAGDLSRDTDDADSDGVINLQEYLEATNPKIPETLSIFVTEPRQYLP